MKAGAAGEAPGAALTHCVARHAAGRPVGVAVSGGGDSMALLVLAAEAGVAARAVSVDHGLRAEAQDEIAAVARLCARLGVPHDILRWNGADARGNLQDAARRARRALIGAWARERGIGAVLLGHTLDDQAETVLMRLARGSGVDGLSGMAEARQAVGVLWLRPFLNQRRETLRDILQARGISWCEDPSNTDNRFGRVRARAALQALAPLGITAEGLAATAERLTRARRALEAQTGAALGALARDDRGTVLVDRAALALPPEIRDRLFAHLLMALTGAPYRPRLASLQGWIARGAERAATLGGCVLRPEGDGLRLWREAQAVRDLVAPATARWDGRWQASPPPGTDPAGVEIRALGDDGLHRLSAQARAGDHPHWRETGLPRAALAGLPGLWRGTRLIAAPLALWPEGWQIAAEPAVTAAPGKAFAD